MDHVAFERAIEQSLHGALPPEEEAALEAHLVGCADCRAYREAVLEARDSLRRSADALAQRARWDRLDGFLRLRLRQERGWAARYAVFCAVSLAALAWVSHGDGPLLAGVGLLSLGVGVFGVMRRRSARAEALAAQKDPLELVFWVRRDLEREAAKSAVLRVVAPLLGLATGAGLPFAREGRQVVLLLGFVVFWGLITAISVRNLRLTRRSLARLRGESP